SLLRRNGLRVSLAESMDTFRALDVIGLADRESVRATLRATMVKRGVDLPAFEQLFALFFSGLPDAVAELTAATAASLGMSEEDFQRFVEELERLIKEAGIELSPLAQALLRADTGTLARLLREASQRGQLGDIQHGFQEGRFSHVIANALGMGGLTEELAQLRAQLLGARPDMAGRLDEYLNPPLQDPSAMIKAMGAGEAARPDGTRGAPPSPP